METRDVGKQVTEGQLHRSVEDRHAADECSSKPEVTAWGVVLPLTWAAY